MNTKNTITIYQSSPPRRGEAKCAAGFTKRFTINPGDIEALVRAIEFDNCPACYADGYRTSANFQTANCILADIDNGHSDESADWITPDHVAATLPGIEHYHYPSRNHMKEKDGKAPRPKYHFIFPIENTTSTEEYSNLMKKLIESFPALHFDPSVKGAAQLNFGVEKAQVLYVDGENNLTDYFAGIGVIPQGQRHSTLISYAACVLKRYGDTADKAHEAFSKEAAKCKPLMDDGELTSIWNSAILFYHMITTQHGV